MNKRITNLINQFIDKYNYKPMDIFSSPGRIELLGNHTDHNNGKVLVSSIDLDIQAVVSKRNDNIINILSINNCDISIDINYIEKIPNENGTTISLVKGILFKLKHLNYKIGGFDLVCDSTIPIGAGVSSSAAFEVLIGEIENYYYNNDKISKLTLAGVGKFAESEYFGKPCGLLDQTGISLGGVNYIDFKDPNKIKVIHLDSKYTNNLINDYQFIIVNTGGSHANLTSYYASIKIDMQEVSKLFKKLVLREVNEDEFNNNIDLVKTKLGERCYLRAKHFFEENQRVDQAYDYLTNNNITSFLNCLTESGLSSYYQLQNCYCEKEEESLAKGLQLLRTIPNTYSRVHGGGFAGTMLLVGKKSDLNNILDVLLKYYDKQQIMLVNITNEGTRHIGEINYEQD